jgi:hypothetical protein
MIPFIKKSYSDIFENLYDITNGNIILGGSVSLRIQNIISRDVNDIDFGINKSDWDKYEAKIIKEYKVYYGPVLLHLHPTMESRVITCLNKRNMNEFHLFINNIEADLFDIIVYNNMPIRVLKPELHLLDKEYMLLDDDTHQNNASDIFFIKKYLNEK